MPVFNWQTNNYDHPGHEDDLVRTLKYISTIDSHTAGEGTRLVMSGLLSVPGGTMAEKKAFVEGHLAWVPGFLLSEPRGHKDLFGAILVPPCTPTADIGVLFFVLVNALQLEIKLAPDNASRLADLGMRIVAVAN